MKIKDVIKKKILGIIYYFKSIIIFRIIKNDKFKVLRRIADSSDYLENRKEINSIIFWTTHKCASTYISKFLELISKESKQKHFDYAGNIWELGNEIKIKDPFDIETNCDFLYREYGEIYGPMRTPFDFSLRDKLNNIFFLRDPRDLIVSKYYSIAYSHPEPSNIIVKKEFLKKRYEARKLGINNFFLKQIDDWIIPHYTKYKCMRENSRFSSFHKYEDLKDNPKKVFFKITKDMNIDISEKMIDELVKSFEKPFKDKKNNKLNDIYSHTRSGENRQFENELSRDILIRGNNKLKDIINYWKFMM